MDDVRGRFLGLLHGTTPAAVTTNKNIMIFSDFPEIMFNFVWFFYLYSRVIKHNPIMVDSFAALFNCTPVDRASDSMMAPT